MFREQEEEAEEEDCVCDLTLDASFDTSQDWGHNHLTCTPTKMSTSNLESDASSPVSFLGPNYSFLTVEDSVNEEGVDKTLSSSDIQSLMGSSVPLTSLDQRETQLLSQPAFIQTSSYPSPSLILTNESQHSSTQGTAAAETSTSNQPQDTYGADPEADPRMTKARGIKTVGDNVDKTVKTRYMRVDQQGHSLHYFHTYATRDRFDLSMPEEAPSIPNDPDLSKLLPSDDDKSSLKQLFAFM